MTLNAKTFDHKSNSTRDLNSTETDLLHMEYIHKLQKFNTTRFDGQTYDANIGSILQISKQMRESEALSKMLMQTTLDVVENNFRLNADTYSDGYWSTDAVICEFINGGHSIYAILIYWK